MSYDCFLCYAKEDKSRVEEIYISMRRAGLKPWMDKPPKPYDLDGLLPGEQWELKIREIISQAHYFVCFFSGITEEKRGFVQKEYRIALNTMSEMPAGRVFVVPVLLEKCTIPRITVEGINFSQFQWHDLPKDGLEPLLRFLTSQKTGSPEIVESAVPYEPKNGVEFLDCLSSFATIHISQSFSLSDVAVIERANVEYEVQFDGTEVILRSLRNVVVRGTVQPVPLIEVSPRYCNVLHFKNCKNITIENLKFGHGPEKGSCVGGVLFFENCEDIFVNNCDLYGCGMEAITLSGSERIFVTNSILRECTYYAASITESRFVKFENCKILDNVQFTGVNFVKSRDVEFVRCDFTGNSFSDPFFVNDGSFRISVVDSKFTKNSASAIESFSGAVEFKNCVHENNDWSIEK